MDIYQILGVTPEEANDLDYLKQQYRRKLLESHPDKAQDSDHSFESVKKAYEILSDVEKRRQYDRVVLRAPVSVSEVIDLDDMDDHETRWTRSCRCGEDEGYAVTEQDLIDNGNAEEINLQCVGCSIWIKVQYSEA